jgi:hypothetical protein
MKIVIELYKSSLAETHVCSQHRRGTSFALSLEEGDDFIISGSITV